MKDQLIPPRERRAKKSQELKWKRGEVKREERVRILTSSPQGCSFPRVQRKKGEGGKKKMVGTKKISPDGLRKRSRVDYLTVETKKAENKERERYIKRKNTNGM